MFRANKRNFSLRDSPSKLSNVSSPLRPRLLSTASPIKRLKLSESVQPLSSTFIQDRPLEDESKPESLNGNRSRFTLCEDRIEKVSGQIETVPQVQDVSAETPPPTPEPNLNNKLENLSKQKLKLMDESRELDGMIEKKLGDHCDYIAQANDLKLTKFKLQDLSAILKESANETRDCLNEIYNPGIELAESINLFMKDRQAGHLRKYERLNMEWENASDQAERLINKRIEDVKHDISLHERTILHREHVKMLEEEKKRAAAEKIQEDGHQQQQEMESPTSPESANKEPVNYNDEIQGFNHDDCIILDGSDDPNVEREEVVTENSADVSESKAQVLDGDETDVDGDQDDESRSFTPRQAQRVD